MVKNIQIWRDRWISNFDFPLTPKVHINPMPLYVSNLWLSGRKSWNHDLITKLFDNVVSNLILNIHISQMFKEMINLFRWALLMETSVVNLLTTLY